MMERSPQEIKEFVRDRYGSRARERLEKLEGREKEAGTPVAESACCAPSAAESSCCGPSDAGVLTEPMVQLLYSAEELKDLPEEALSSLGCGNPTAIAGLKEGEHVLDLGSGGGLDCFLAAQKVGPTGKAVGLDMTPDMLDLARRNARKVGLSNVEFHRGEMESMPFPGDVFDVIISNCVINLSPDKDAVFRESFRVLKPGGRVRVSDIVWLREPTEAERSNMEGWAGCVAGALRTEEYANKLSAAGFANVQVRLGDANSAQGFTSAYVEAEKPVAGQRTGASEAKATAPPAASPEGTDRTPGRCC
jgi:SAM-dependent methyltransferase